MYGDPVLRETSEKIEDINQDVKDLVSDMWDTLKKARGLGLAAVQIGVLKRVFIVDFSSVDLHESFKVFINPVHGCYFWQHCNRFVAIFF